MKVQKILIIILVSQLININWTYSNTITTSKDTIKNAEPGNFFANIYTGFYYRFNTDIKPQTAFEFTTGLLGYSRNLSDNVKAILIYDVTRTTNFSYTDSSGISNYFEGSKYTAFLKMGEIDWKINSLIELNVGQLLNEQYLTVQDKFWGYRYIAFTFQEIYRFGMPADFGARLKFNWNKKLMFSATVMNGEGPFRYQDSDGNYLYAGNLEITPNKNLIIKVYGDYMLPSDNNLFPRIAFSGFLGYRKDKFKIGAEYNEVFNQAYIEDLNYSGASLYSSYSINKKVDVIGRCDYLIDLGSIENGQYYLLGLQYSPAEKFYTSVNTRYNEFDDYFQLYFNFGAKF